MRKLGDVCAFDKAQGIHRGLPYVGLEHIESHTARFIGSSEAQPVKSSTFKFTDEHVLYGRLRPYLNKALAPDFVGHCSTEIFPLKPRSEVSRDYLLYWLLADETCDRINATCTGARMPRADMKEVLGFDFPLPPLAEQQRIVGLLDEAFAGLATARAHAAKNLQNARALFESHLQSVFTQRGPGWVETTVDKISTNLDSKRVPITKNVRSSGEYPYYGASGIVDYVAEYIFDGDALLVSEDGANLLARSTPIAFSVSGKYWVNNHAHILKFDDMATQRFVEFYLESIKLDEYITGAAQPKLNQKALNSISIPIPTLLDEQRKIVESVESLQEETQRLATLYTRKLAALEALKKSLLHQAFTGHL
ncbi:MAG: restriction endonuclease subunit S [Terrimicrobiaceae bacterium]|nr:restriction endonuclease subunit S [Terrimicrobiaceae bacterium]